MANSDTGAYSGWKYIFDTDLKCLYYSSLTNQYLLSALFGYFDIFTIISSLLINFEAMMI